MKRSGWVLCFFLFLVFLFAGGAYAKSYYHPRIVQSFLLLENGDVEVSEERYFSFEGSFSWAELRILRKGVEDIQFEGVWDAQSGELLPYEVLEDAEAVGVRWSYRARDETRAFRIKYLLKGAVECYQDVAQFYWKVIEDQHTAISELESTFTLPQPSPELFKLFVHSKAPPGEMTFSEDRRTVRFRLQNIPADSFVEVRLLSSPSLFSAASPLPQRRYEAILEEERRLASKELRVYLWGTVAAFLLVGFGIFYLLLFVVYYFRYGREPHLDYQREYEQEPPLDISPCFLGVILSQKRDNSLLSRAFLATILDLARRGFLTVREEERKGWIRKREYLVFRFTDRARDRETVSAELNRFEAEVLDLLFKISKDGEEVSTVDIENWGKEMRANRSNFLRFLGSWGRDLREEFEKRYFKLLDPLSEKKKNLFTALGVVYFIGGIFLLILLAVISPLVFLGVPFLILALFFALLGQKVLRRWSREAALIFRRFMAFRKFLSDFSLMREAPPTLLEIWDRYLIYAVVLGVAEKLLRNLRRYAEETHRDLVAPSWYYPVHGAAFGLAALDALSGLDALSHRMENLANLRQALSSSSSVGGGFSGGGGGGGGGGSSSAG